MAPARPSHVQTYELLDDGQRSIMNPERPTSSSKESKSQLGGELTGFIVENPTMVIAPLVGLSGALVCFGFTRWLSQQMLLCPSWALYCEVLPAVVWFRARLGLVQGVVGSIYGLSITLIGYMLYRLAETTLWPAWSRQTMTPLQVDEFLATARGSLAAFPSAVWHSRRLYQAMVALTVGLFGILLHINSSVVGYAFTIDPVPTVLHSNHTIGGGIGFGFTQSNPPGAVPAEIGIANALYSSWSSAQAIEPLPELRRFLINRNNMSQIGNFSVNAIEVVKRVNCSAMPVELYAQDDIDGDAYSDYAIATHINANYTLARFALPLTSWVDRSWSVSNSRAIARVIFAALNGVVEGSDEYGYEGSIEGAYINPLSDGMIETCEAWDLICSGLSSLACDIDIDLVNSQACLGDCQPQSPTLSSTKVLQGVGLDPIYSEGEREIWPISQWLAAIVTTMSPYVSGLQPMFVTGTVFSNDTNNTLPVAYTDAAISTGNGNWTQANITNFIDVAVGALAMSIVQGWQLNLTANVTVESRLPLERLNRHRALALLVPPAISIGLALVLAALNVAMHRDARLSELRLAQISELVLSCQTRDLADAVVAVRNGKESRTTLEEMDLRYGRLVSDGHEGIAKAEHVLGFNRLSSRL